MSFQRARSDEQREIRRRTILDTAAAMLGEMPVEDVERISPLLGEAVSRLRQGRVIRDPGYDGEYGTIRLFDAAELPGRASRRRT